MAFLVPTHHVTASPRSGCGQRRQLRVYAYLSCATHGIRDGPGELLSCRKRLIQSSGVLDFSCDGSRFVTVFCDHFVEPPAMNRPTIIFGCTSARWRILVTLCA